MEINNDTVKGRHLKAKKDLVPGEVLISEDAFSALPTAHAASVFCNQCFKVLEKKPVQCAGCFKAVYCNAECRRSAWKIHHWFECCINCVEVGVETRLSLRTLLCAAFSLSEEGNPNNSLLQDITQQLFSMDLNSDCTGCSSSRDGNVYYGNYWSVYSLQTHVKQPEVNENAGRVLRDVITLSNIMDACFVWHDSFIGNKTDGSWGESQQYTKTSISISSLPHDLFKKLRFASYFEAEDFDILSWRSYMVSCVLSKKQHRHVSTSTPLTLEHVYNQQLTSIQDLCLRLLLHHALQFRTNVQAIFSVSKLASDDGSSPLENLCQLKIATAFFPTASLMNHSCSPNTSVSFHGSTIKVVAVKPIHKGEEVCHCYGPQFTRHTVEERRDMLREQYFFDCNCEKCLSELSGDEETTSFRLQFRAFKCRYCGDPVKPGSGTTTDSSTATCINTKCNRKQDISTSRKTYEEAKNLSQKASELLDCGHFDASKQAYQQSLKKMESVLFPWHIDIGEVNDKIAQCYVTQEKYSSAVSHLCKSITIVGMMHGAQSVELAHELQKLATVYFNGGQMSNGAKTAKKALAIYKLHYTRPECCPPGVEEMRRIVELCG